MQVGDYHDTIVIPLLTTAADYVGLRVQPGQFSGYGVLHCHLLQVGQGRGTLRGGGTGRGAGRAQVGWAQAWGASVGAASQCANTSPAHSSACALAARRPWLQ